MKKILSVLVVLLMTGVVAHAQTNNNGNNGQQQQAPAKSAVKFDHVVYDFGEIEYNADGNHTFTFKNVSKAPITVTNVSTSCGCTTPNYSKEPVMPGKSGNITAHYDTTRIGQFTKTLTVTINDEQIVLTIKGTVKPPKSDSGH